MNPLDRLTSIIASLMAKEPDAPDVLKAVVEVVMAIREPSHEMLAAGLRTSPYLDRPEISDIRDEARTELRQDYQAMIDALLTEGDEHADRG